MLGRFEIVNELGRGAMGVVYKGRDPKLERDVALKVIQFSMNKEDEQQLQVKERFLVEARATAALQHPNILTIYDVGDEADLTYIAMEFLQGGSLEDMIKKSSFHDYDQIIDIVRQIADGLDHAHAKGIVHRDIKPANIMMAGGKIPKIADFGLARLSNSTLTTTGTVLGTPSYMAPEQIRGRKVDGRADLFALAVIFYEMLTGEKPFGGDSITSVIYRVVNEEPIPPRKLNIDLPDAIDQFMQKALTKEPAQRFQTGAEFAEALRLLQKGLYKAQFTAPGAGSASADSLATQRLTANETSEILAPKKGNKGLIIGGAIGAAVVVIAAVAILMGGGKKEEAAQDAAPVEQAAEAPAKQDKRAEPAKKAAAPAPKKAAAAAKPGAPSAVLTVNSEPAKARVLIDGEAVGFTPFKEPVPLGSHTLKIEKKGHETYTEKFNLKRDTKISTTLVKKEAPKEKTATAKKEEKKEENGGFFSSGGTGTLIVNAKEGDKVTVDGLSYSTFPVTVKNISSGNHNVLVIRKGAKKPFLKSVPVKSGETVKVTPDF